MMRGLLLAVVAATGLTVAAPAMAEDPADMALRARSLAEVAPEALTRRTLAQVALPTYSTAKFRNVRAFYIRQELINDQVIFCGEVDVVVPNTKNRSGWTKFVYIPGDPTTLMTDTPGLGTREIGPQVRQRMCEEHGQNWLSTDFTAAFQRMPKSMAEAENAG
jgi:hypothetical protein